ncbi:hypothetical protein RGQ13_12910 [Thalassotalea psychrophila]|uniref:Uncharacterized protein n=1 Tax=Thalassotalea psychrophila TaxID=3065647 RepID=A0ABY9TQJ3_9GAMM|nr:hypothetical protein RGQ13_12910 [Colwelliaceae bacterium SQ149]
MNNQRVIPEKIKINLLYDYLELSAMNQAAKLEALISHSQDGGLLFTFNHPVRAIPVEIPIGDYDETGEYIPTRNEDIQCIFKPKSFTLNNYSIDEECTRIGQFEVNGVAFNIINKDKTDYGFYDVDLADVYVKKSDFIKFDGKSGDNVLSDLPVDLQPTRTNKACKLAPRQEVLKPSSRDQRYEFLKEWTQRTLPGVPFDKFIAAYDIELTKETFYKLLSNEYKKNHPNDSNIFIKGADDFYKDKRFTLKFKEGRRKNS